MLGVWGLASLVRLSRLVEPPAAPPGSELGPQLLDFLRRAIPPDAGYLFVEPNAFGADTGTGQRLRYELYPRAYDDIRLSVDEATVRQQMQSEHLTFVVVADATQYPADSWLRQPRDWVRRVELDATRYVLAVVG